MTPIILSGGSGSRLWPVSRQAYPKQFADLLDESLFAKTVKRLQPLGSPWIVTVQKLKTLTERSMTELGLPSDLVLYEPTGKNTAPAVALVCRAMALRGKSQEIVGIFPADHLIGDDQAFRKAVETAARFAEQGRVVTLGVQPTYAATAYGYIETSGYATDQTVGGTALRAIGFREKPNQETARQFLSRGGFYWNAGMFIFRVQTMIDLFQKHAPDVWTAFEKLKPDLSNLADVYNSARAISIDYALMERLSEHVCIPCSFSWSDLGSWDAMSDVDPRFTKNQPQKVEVASSGNYVYPNFNKTYGFVGVDDLIVVDTADALLVTTKGKSEMVRDLVDKMTKDKNDRVTEHRFEIRPWGRFEVLSDGAAFKSKIITVDPGAQISYQSHAKRSEHWVMISGAGEVVLDEKVIPVGPGQHVHVPVGTKHRIRNNGTLPLQFVEVQTGSYFGEDDIVRYQDDYQRK